MPRTALPKQALPKPAPSPLTFESTVIPRPSELRSSPGAFDLGQTLSIGHSAAHGSTAIYLEAALKRLLGTDVETQPLAAAGEDRPTITLSEDVDDSTLGDEGYRLEVSPTQIIIRAGGAAGAFYGVQTLLQLIPTPAVTPHLSESALAIPCVHIVDCPRFPWRGLMLDVSRHFLPPRDVMRFLDSMAMHKLNVFHWHLVDNQGWRVQSHLHPRLNDIGAWRQGAQGQLASHLELEPPRFEGVYGGFYTHEQIREIVAYAAKLHITVIPEFEMPGHALSALAAYPELSCTGGPFEVMAQIGHCHDVYCAGNDATFAFIESVLDEWLALFPSKLIHLGGDECSKDRWKACPKCQARMRHEGLANEDELQSYFIRRVSKMLTARGRRLIGWDEILEGGLADGAAVMSWRGTEGGIAAAKAGHDAVLCPYSHCYLDYRQADTGEPVAMGDQTLTLGDVYTFDPPTAGLTAEQQRHVLGVQGNVWTEHIFDIDQVEYMVWPRAAAIAEIGWTQASRRDADDFMRRAAINERRLIARGTNVRRQR